MSYHFFISIFLLQSTKPRFKKTYRSHFWAGNSHGHKATECSELDGTTMIIETNSSINGPYRDGTHNCGVISTML